MYNEQFGEPVSVPRTPVRYPIDKKDIWFALGIFLCALAMVNVVFFGGLHLAFAVVMLMYITLGTIYLRTAGGQLKGYGVALLVLSAVITAGFARSDDDFVKLVMAGFLVVAVNLALCLQSGQNHANPAGIRSLPDSLLTALRYGLGAWGPTIGGLKEALRGNGVFGKKVGPILVGLLVSLPVLVIMALLLVSADAAFEGVIGQMPEFEVGEAIVTVLFGGLWACILVSHSLSLRHHPAQIHQTTPRPGSNPLTVNTVLAMVSALYLVYLFSQLAYFAGGFSGILPEDFTLAEYARRGFFEMGALCAINLAIIALTVGLVRKEPKTPLLTRLLCLFLGVMTLLFVVSASAKMGMYIKSYGLTRLRVLTEVIMLFLGVATLAVCLWLFIPRLPYMKVVVLTAMLFGAVVIWVDVDTVVAHYNVSAYQSGAMETVDVHYLSTLNASALPYLEILTEDSDPQVAQEASGIIRELQECGFSYWEDFRDWNWADWVAENLLNDE